MPDYLSTELVAVIWLRTLAGLPSGAAGGVASTLPKTPNAAGDHAWPDGFVVVTGLGGFPSIERIRHTRRERVLVDCHYLTVDTQRPRWNRSLELAETIINATLPNLFDPVELTPASPLDAYPTVRLRYVRHIGGPERRIGDAGNHAVHRLTLELDWDQDQP